MKIERTLKARKEKKNGGHQTTRDASDQGEGRPQEHQRRAEAVEAKRKRNSKVLATENLKLQSQIDAL